MNNSILSILEFILALSFLLFIHELGHFLVGKLFGIQAEEFGFGYPPKLLKLFSWKGTDFTINLIPFGAFVRFKGEEDPQAADGLYAANKWKRLGTLLAGPAMNLITGVLLFSLVFSQTGIPQSDIVNIAGVVEGSPAQIAGLQEGDTIIAINDASVNGLADVQSLIQKNLGDETALTIQRADQKINLILIPRSNPPEGEGAIGIIMQNPIEKVGFLRAIPLGGNLALEQGRQLLAIPAMLIRGEAQSEEMRMLSPKGIYDVYSQVREEERVYEQQNPMLAFSNIAWFFGVISIALGFSNLLPIPALDGGRILFILPEIIFNKRVPARYENLIHMIGYTSLLLIMGYVLYQDIINPIVLP